MKDFIFIAIIVTGLVLFVAGSTKLTPAQVVYDTCQRTRTTAEKEHECARVQDYYGIEYLCKDRNNSPNNICWTESKVSK